MSIKPREWNNLIEALKDGSCVVLLGPSISTGEDGSPPLNHQFAKKLTVELEKENVVFDKEHEDNLTYIMQRFTTISTVAPSDPGYEAKNFYSEYKGKFNSIQKTLAELPFNLIINTSPDDAMVHALKQAGKFETMYAWYDYRKEHKQEIVTPTAEAPLVYNLFGHYENAMSLVLTQSDQVEFTKNVIKDQPPLPPKLIGQLDSHKTYLFLGFDWEQWNLRLLLEGLNLEKQARVLAHSRHDIPLKSITKDFYKSSFQFSFITDDISSFVQELKDKFGAENQESKEVSKKKVFIVADSKDEPFRDELYKNLKPLQMDVLHEGLIEAGEDINEAVKNGMETADIILLLVSADFLASDDLYKREWPLALKQKEENKSIVVPVITRACNWQELTELTQMATILPRKGLEVGKPINSWETPDEAYNMIVKEIQGELK